MFDSVYYKSADDVWLTLFFCDITQEYAEIICDSERREIGRQIAQSWKDDAALIEVIGLWGAEDGTNEGEICYYWGDAQIPFDDETVLTNPACWVKRNAQLKDPAELKAISGKWFPVFGVDEETAQFLRLKTLQSQLSLDQPPELRVAESMGVPIQYGTCGALVDDETNNHTVGVDLYLNDEQVPVYLPYFAGAHGDFWIHEGLRKLLPVNEWTCEGETEAVNQAVNDSETAVSQGDEVIKGWGPIATAIRESERTARRLEKSGKLKISRINGRPYCHKSEIDRYFKENYPKGK